MKLSRFLLGVPVLALIAGCATTSLPSVVSGPVKWPNLKIEALSDLHLYAPELGTSGPAWDKQDSDAFELFKDSQEIIQTAVARVAADKPDLVLLSGDLTKDGERASHELMAKLLRPLGDAGIPVLVIPGNHDILNPAAVGYSGALPEKVPSVSPAEFATIYRDFGYESALSRDPHSLSYIAEPVPGLRVLALDTCRYEENQGKADQVGGGRIRAESWVWIDQVLDQAASDKVPVVAMMHHVLVESFAGQSRVFADFILQDNSAVQKHLADRGVKVVFTGHFHNLSLSVAHTDGHPLLDIGDGTLVTFPIGYRKISIADQKLHVETDYVKELPSTAAQPGVFYAQARERLVKNSMKKTAKMMETNGFLGKEEAEALAGWFGPTYLAIVQGNPEKPKDWTWPPRNLGILGTLVAGYMGDVPENIWKPRANNDLTIDFSLED